MIFEAFSVCTDPQDSICQGVWNVFADVEWMTARWHQILVAGSGFCIQISDNLSIFNFNTHVEEWNSLGFSVICDSEFDELMLLVKVV